VAPSTRPPAGFSHTDDGPERRVGTLIKGKWTVDALLGVGGMASVYSAWHRNGQRAALKVLHNDLARDKDICDRFRREAYLSNKVSHPACVAILDDDQTDDRAPFLVMELLEGSTVRDLWKRAGQRMAVLEVLKICDDVLDCLIACHAIGVIHRDLKPANIFVTRAGITKVLDFGVAQMRSATHERTATGTALGTPAYMSPEQAMGLVDELDGRTDLFSVGAMMHSLTTGRRINNGRSENEALVMAATTPVPSVARIAPHLPVELISLIDKSLAWDRRNRHADACEMQAAVRALRGILGGGAGGAKSSPVPVAPAAARDEARAGALRDLFKRIERILPSVRQFGWGHPATEQVMTQAFNGFADALQRDPEVVDFTIRPYSMLHRGETVWEPIAPFDAIPYHLFACGIRGIRMDPGLTLDELREVFTLMLIDPGRDLPPEDDLAAAFWERAMPHVHCDVVDAFAEGDASEREAFYDESDEVEQMARRASSARISHLEARAMAVTTDLSTVGSGRAIGPMAIDDVVRTVLSQQLVLTRDQWSQRYVDVLVDGYVDAAVHRDAPLVLASLRRSTADLIVAGSLGVGVRLHAALVSKLGEKLEGQTLTRLSSALTNAMFGGEALELALKHLHSNPDAICLFDPILDVIGPGELRCVLRAFRRGSPAGLRESLLRFIERSLEVATEGAVVEVAAAAAGLDPEDAFAILSILGRLSTPEAREALVRMSQSEDVNIRVEARVLAAGQVAHTELSSMCEDSLSFVRVAAVRAAVRHRIKGAWTAIARQVRLSDFNDRGNDERREFIRALVTLSPDRGEPIALELAKRGGVFVSQSREATRVAAAEALGAVSRSPEVAAELREIAETRWGTSDETRSAAAIAAGLITSRFGGRGSGLPGAGSSGGGPVGAVS